MVRIGSFSPQLPKKLGEKFLITAGIVIILFIIASSLPISSTTLTIISLILIVILLVVGVVEIKNIKRS